MSPPTKMLVGSASNVTVAGEPALNTTVSMADVIPIVAVMVAVPGF